MESTVGMAAAAAFHESVGDNSPSECPLRSKFSASVDSVATRPHRIDPKIPGGATSKNPDETPSMELKTDRTIQTQQWTYESTTTPKILSATIAPISQPPSKSSYLEIKPL